MDSTKLLDAYARLLKGTTWSAPATSKCPGFAINNPGEAKRVDDFVKALAAGQPAVLPTMLTDTGFAVVGMLDAMRIVVAPEPTPVPGTNSLAPTTKVILFEDNFDGPAGSKPDPAKWEIDSTVGESWDNWAKMKPENVYLDGQGNLVLLAKRDVAGPNGLPYSGGLVATYGYHSGYPASGIRAQWDVPFRFESRWRMPPVDGSHVAAAWLQRLDAAQAGGHVFELDCGESHSSLPLKCGFYQHDWVNGLETNVATGEVDVSSNWRENFHTVRADVYADRVEYYLDDVKYKTYYGVTGKFGLVMHNPISRDPWQNGGKLPDPASPGPWPMLVSHVRAVRL